jgi:hypothetical protein
MEGLRSGDIERTPLSFWGKVRAELPQIAGEELGAATGAYLGARQAAKLPAGHPLLKGGLVVGGAILGAGAGAMSARGYEQMYRMTRPGSKSMTFDEIYKEQLWAGAEGAISEMLGRGMVAGGGKLLKTRAGQKVLAPFKNIAIPGVERLNAILNRAGRTLPPDEYAKLTKHAQELLDGHGAFLTAAQSTRGRGLDWVENATDSSIFGGNRLFQLKRFLQPAAYKNAVKQMSERFWKEAGEKMSPAEVGQLFVDTVTKKRAAQRSLENIAYKNVDALTKGNLPNFAATKVLAEKMVKEANEAGRLGQQRGIATLANKVQKWADTPQSFMQGHSWRSGLLEEVRALEAKQGGRKLAKVRGAAKRLSAHVDAAMSKAAKASGPDAYTAWRGANKLVREGVETLDSEAIAGAMRLARRKPELVAKSVFTRHGTETLKAVRKGVDDKTYRTILASYLDDTITKYSGTAFETTGVPSGTRILDHMEKNLGEDMMQEMFESPAHLQDFLDVMKLGFVLERRNQAGGGMVIQLMQAGGLADIATKLPAGEPARGASWLINIGPAVVGRLLSNPNGAKWLSTGFKLSGKAQQKWFAKIPPSLVRIIREGVQPERPPEKRMPSPRLPNMGLVFTEAYDAAASGGL